MDMAKAIQTAVTMSNNDGCTRYVAARLVRSCQGGITVDTHGFKVTDWSDDSCVVRVNGEGDWEYLVEREQSPVHHPEGWKLV